MIEVKVNGKGYQFLTQYKDNDVLRKSFNALTRKVYEFDFEKWYESGYWTDNCLLYSLADGDKIISHVTVNVIDFVVLNDDKRYVQLGTVMTDPEYRNQGLGRALMEIVLQEWTSKCDLVYLFANDSVLDFYPKFGFVPVQEYEAVYTVDKSYKVHPFRKMDMDNEADRNLLHHIAQHAFPLFKISMKDNAGLVMFYAKYFDLFSLADDLYYIEDLNAIAIATQEDNTLILYDVLTLSEVEIKEVFDTLIQPDIEKVVLNFMPMNTDDYTISPFKEENSTLFVLGDHEGLFQKNQLMFPLLSHT